MQWVEVLLLLRLFEPCVFETHRTIQYIHHHHNNNRIALIVTVSETNQEHISAIMILYHHIITHFLGFEMIRNISQHPWVFISDPFTYPLVF